MSDTWFETKKYKCNFIIFTWTYSPSIIFLFVRLYIGVEILQLIYMEETWSYLASSCLNPLVNIFGSITALFPLLYFHCFYFHCFISTPNHIILSEIVKLKQFIGMGVSGFHFIENWLSVNWNRESYSKPIPITEIIISFHF